MHMFFAPICLQEEDRARVLERFCAFIRGGLSKGLLENDVTREARRCYGACSCMQACGTPKVFFAFVWQAFKRYGHWVAEWPGFAQKLLEAGLHCASCRLRPLSGPGINLHNKIYFFLVGLPWANKTFASHAALFA